MNAKLQLFGLEETVTRPIIIQVLRDIAKEIGCVTKPYLYIDDNSAIKKTRSPNKSKHSSNSNSPIRKFSGKTKEYLKVTSMSDNVTPGYEIDTNISFPKTKPFFFDREINFQVKTIIQERKLDLSIEYSTLDKAYLHGVINILRTLPTYSECKFLHNLEYKLFMPGTVKRLLGHIYKRKKNRWTDDEMLTFRDYVYSIADDRLTEFIPHKSSADGFKMGIREKLVEVLGVLNTDVHNLTIESNEEGYSINLDYTIYYQIPIAIDVTYPLVVYNSLISKKEMNFTPRTGRTLSNNNTSDLIGLRRYFKDPLASDYMGKINSYVKYPLRDDTMPNVHPDRLTRLVTNLFLVNDKDPREVMNIDEIQGAKFKYFVKQFILASEYKYVTKSCRSYLYFALYENDVLLNDKLEMDEKGNIRTTFDMNIRKTYRLVIFLLTDLNYLNMEDRRRITSFLNATKESSNNFCTYQKEKLIKTHNGEKNIKSMIMEIENRYLSSLDTFREIYGLSDEQVKLIERNYGKGLDIVDIIKLGKVKTPKHRQIFSTALNNLFE